ncbi:MAG TPA: Asp-tRNA(Asn)/Glu-tRNA(Gln) amidotransferase GatCAB subunit B [Deltaproteobacteria bacterium]|nr:MAG: aspartyl/glutamyl-tRNA amidotransferase subunit B [Deltaproteobacteria bacterium GWA2_55_82]OGQ64172.1 MAG: aspartyl/glutamyl-tRNA amidotransferase subunit B [Deltaproteobacteria bacterium RIFCSPLOWO2_02_FULL_55_12]OIJ74625.1 MAG: aspartyl/glutamyl-tRNA amidotransferase subunit B [Deltaproteobacteria bacterium GWC2_55_46]HBG46431.1 Asp-tRNA(Asn)/Glu-tRNA(Gln) amidotransferase GatCAB subunit B [Deltaproteobacteria bacterium]HCY10643.1 Asp-tRNA(Asn)/Glu-tRNA(Gln) amidotransferase GatCAB s
MKYEAVIGLEVHAQLLTDSKLFCGCSTKFGSEPNTQVDPVCLGMPGVLPVLNKRAVEYAIKMALATGCRVNHKSVFARKNYFYPDLPKGYQISQYTEPLAEHGWLDIDVDGVRKRIGITRIHMEEDAGKLIHGEGPEDEAYSFVDLNRTGVPLIEIVSEPDMRASDEAQAYLKAIRDILVYLGISSGNMEEGSFRCDANISVRPVGAEKLGTKAELKNMNSFKFVKEAIDYEIQRQIDLIESGGKVVQETRLFDSSKGITASMRSKEEAHDYRYFPEPDLLPLMVEDSLVEGLRSTLPELPQAKRERFTSEYGIPAYDAGVLTASRDLANYYEEVVKETSEPKVSSNWVMGEILRLLNEDNKEISDCPVSPKAVAGVIKMVKDGQISGKIAKEVLEEMYKTGKSANEIVKAQGLTQISGEDELGKIVDEIISANPENAARYREGKVALFGFFVGEAMKATKGKANPQVINKLLKEKLG